MTDYDILYVLKIGDTVIKDCTTPTLLGWVAGKLNNLKSSSPMSNELTMMLVHPPMGSMSDYSKLEVIRKMEKLGIQLC